MSYPVAIGQKNYYFLLDNVYVDKEEFDKIKNDNKNLYQTFYKYG